MLTASRVNRRAVAIALALICAAGMTSILVLLAIGAGADAPSGWGTPAILVILDLLPIGFVITGTFVAVRQPANRLGWVCLGIAVLLSVDPGLYGSYGRDTGAPALPGADFATWLGNWLFLPAIGGIGTFLLLLFPTGQLLSPRWRIAAWASAVVIVLASVATAFHPGTLPSAPGVANPYPVEAVRYIPGYLPGGANAFLAPCFAAAAVSVVLRFRRASGRERLQMKWFASAAALVAVLFGLVAIANLVAGLLDAGRPLGLRLLEDGVSLSVQGLPIAIGIAVLKHDLYEIDVVINRTLVYGALTASLAAVYVGTVLLLQLVLSGATEGSGPAVAVSTLAVAGLFRPLRARIQAGVDRRFFRRRYDAARTLEGFGTRLRDEVELDALEAALRVVVAETMQPAHVSLWVRDR